MLCVVHQLCIWFLWANPVLFLFIFVLFINSSVEKL